MPEDLMRYDQLAQNALRGVVREALRKVERSGLPGEHHFYIAFNTKFAGVNIGERLAQRYPREMTIVLQHQYWDLAPGETFFSVTLKFGGQPKRLSVPYAAVTRFYDPSVQFLLSFETTPAAGAAPAPAADKPAPATDAADVDPEAANVVSLDQFRKK